MLSFILLRNIDNVIFKLFFFCTKQLSAFKIRFLKYLWKRSYFVKISKNDFKNQSTLYFSSISSYQKYNSVILFLISMGSHLCGETACPITEPTMTVAANQSFSVHQSQHLLPLHSFTPQKIQIPTLPTLHPEVEETFYSKDKQFIKLQEKHKVQIKQFDQDIYEGEVNHIGQPHGIGRLFKSDGSLYSGHFIEGKAQGEGLFILKDGSYFQGKLENNMANCRNGQFRCKQFVYNGGFKCNKFNGEGRQKSQNYSFIGTYQNGLRVCGQLKWWNLPGPQHEYCYYGKFDENGLFTDDGVLKEPEGKYVGTFLNGKKHGEGMYRFNNCDIKYEGGYVCGLKQGKGKVSFLSSGSLIYEGGWRNNLPEGEGFKFDEKGSKLKTVYKNGINILCLKDPHMFRQQ